MPTKPKQSVSIKLTDYQRKELEEKTKNVKASVADVKKQVDSVSDTDMFYLFRVKFNCSNNKGARSVNRVRMNKLLDIYDEIGEKKDSEGVLIIEKIIEDQFQRYVLDKIIKYPKRENLPSEIKETFISDDNYNYIQRLQNRFNTTIDELGFPFRLGDEKNDLFFYVMSNEQYLEVTKPMTDNELNNINKHITKAVEDNKDVLDILISNINPVRVPVLQFVLNLIKEEIRKDHPTGFFFGMDINKIIEEIQIKPIYVPQYKPSLSQCNEYLASIYYALQNHLLVSIIERIPEKNEVLNEKQVKSIIDILEKSKKLNILGDQELVNLCEDINKKLKVSSDTKDIKKFLNETARKFTLKSGIQVKLLKEEKDQ